MSNKYDAIIIGGGHNGLVCANYLAMQGMKVCVLERREIVGGAAITEEFHPGFRNSVASYTVSLLNPKVIEDLELKRHGLEIVERKVNNFWPQPNGDFLAFPVGSEKLKEEIARFSVKDSEALPRYLRDVEMAADVIRGMLLKPPPNVGGKTLTEIFKGLDIFNMLRGQKLAERDFRVLYDIFTLSVNDFLSQYFENEYVKGAFAWDGVVGNYASPHDAGTAYVLMHHAFGEVNGKKGVWGHAVGGMGSITQAMAASAREKGVEIRTDASVREVLAEYGKVKGVVLEDGTELNANIVVSNVNPKLLYTKLIAPDLLPPEFNARIKQYKNASGTFRMNVALDRLPQFTCLEGRGTPDHLTGGIVIGPTIDYLERAYLSAKQQGWSDEPLIEILIPSTLDDSLAPEGKHVASLFCQQFDPNVDWDAHRDEVADKIIETVDKYAPGFKDSVVGRQVLSPLDLERKLALTGGDIMHGVLSLNQMFSARPLLGYGDYRSPLKGLYMCGSGTHPGGGVTGAPGHNAAREIIKDTKGFWFLPKLAR